MKRTLKILAAILSVVLLTQSIAPLGVVAQPGEAAEAIAVSPILTEDISKREIASKVFECEDGTFLYTGYGSPVHYEENGMLKDIDNTLELSSRALSASGQATYVPRASAMALSLPQDFSYGQQVEVSNKGYTFGFAPSAENQGVSLFSAASLVDVDALPSAIASRQGGSQENSQGSLTREEQIQEFNAEKMAVDNLSSAAVYSGAFSNTHLEYVVLPDRLKENMVVASPQAEYIYRFDVSMAGLAAVPQEDGSILLVAANNPDEVIFVLEVPYMYDANGEMSYDVEMILENGVLTVIADTAWANSEERAWPIVIDPTVDIYNTDIENTTQSVIKDAYVSSLFPYGLLNNDIRLYAGKTFLGERTRTYVRINMPTTIPSNAQIQYGQLEFKKSSNNDPALQIHDLYSTSKNLDLSTLTWNSQPISTNANSFYSLPWVATTYTASGSTWYRFNISSALQRWHAGGRNNGLVITTENENNNGQVELCSTRAVFSSNQPIFWFSYATGTVTITYNGNGQTSGSGTIPAPQTVSTPGSVEISSPGDNLKKTGYYFDGWTLQASSGALPAGYINGSILDPGDTVSWPAITDGTLTLTAKWVALPPTTGTVNVTYSSIGHDAGIAPSPVSVITPGGITLSSPGSLEKEGCVFGGWKLQDPGGILPVGFSDGDICTANTYIKWTTLKNGTLTLKAVWLDKVEGLFNYVTPDGLTGQRSSDDYYHPLATWAVDLSYGTYLPLGPIPPSLIEAFAPNAKPIDTILGDNGFTYETFPNASQQMASTTNLVLPPATIPPYNKLEDNGYGTTDLFSGMGNNVWYFYSNTLGFDNAAISLAHGGVNAPPSGASGIFSPEDTVHTIAHRKIVVGAGGNTRDLIIVAIRGTESINDIVTDFTFTFFDELHEGFTRAKDEVLKNLLGDENDNIEGYINKYANELDDPDPIILITGHSLGGAVANLLADDLMVNEGWNSEDVYTYTFATPTGTDTSIKYGNIFNILNRNDVVTYVPPWLVRHGMDIPITMSILPAVPIELPTFEFVTGFINHVFPYLPFMHELDEFTTYEELMFMSYADVSVGGLPRLLSFFCPVGITIYDDEDNELASEGEGGMGPRGGGMGSRSSNEPESDIVSWTDDDAKFFFVPYGSDAAYAYVTAYDSGTMDFTIATIDASFDNPQDSKTFENVELYAGKEFMVVLADGSGETAVLNTQLLIVENDEVVGEVLEDGTEIYICGECGCYEGECDCGCIVCNTCYCDKCLNPIDPYSLEEPLLQYLLSMTEVPSGQIDALVDEILELDILSLDLLREIYETEGYTETETDDLIAILLRRYSTDQLYMLVHPVIYGYDLNNWFEPDDELWPWIWFLQALVLEFADCLVEVLDLDLGDENDIVLGISAIEQIFMCYVYLIRANQHELHRIAKHIVRDRSEEITLLYQALATLLSGEAETGELDFTEIDENEAIQIFETLLPSVLPLEVPNLTKLLRLCNWWGYTRTQTEDTVELIVAFLATEPFLAAMYLADDELGGKYASYYTEGPVQSGGGCGDLSSIFNPIILASANYYPIASAIRSRAFSVLALDPQDENDAELVNLISVVFLYCYFADYIEQVNIWLVAQGDDPMDFGDPMSQVSQMTTQMGDMLATLNSGGIQTLQDPNSLTGFFTQVWASIGSFFSNLF